MDYVVSNSHVPRQGQSPNRIEYTDNVIVGDNEGWWRPQSYILLEMNCTYNKETIGDCLQFLQELLKRQKLINCEVDKLQLEDGATTIWKVRNIWY